MSRICPVTKRCGGDPWKMGGWSYQTRQQTATTTWVPRRIQARSAAPTAELQRCRRRQMFSAIFYVGFFAVLPPFMVKIGLGKGFTTHGPVPWSKFHLRRQYGRRFVDSLVLVGRVRINHRSASAVRFLFRVFTARYCTGSVCSSSCPATTSASGYSSHKSP